MRYSMLGVFQFIMHLVGYIMPSLTGLPDPSPLFAVFSVFVDDKAGKLFGGNE
jgi:hypothetical protein